VIGKTRWLGLLLIVLLVAVGCKSSIGAKTISGDQFNYAEALREAWKEQMLLNMVGLRYAEAPTFLKVTSVINQYSLDGSITAAAPPYQLQAAAAPPLGISGRYSDRPTITYMPLTGAEFTRSVMTPIPPSTIMALIQAGWQADLPPPPSHGAGHQRRINRNESWWHKFRPTLFQARVPDRQGAGRWRALVQD
jgi:hypothetical protein